MEAKQVLFFFSLFILGVVSHKTSFKGHLGNYEPIKDLKDPYVVEIAKFAVNEHDKTKSKDLVFVDVVSAEKRVLSHKNDMGSDERHEGCHKSHEGHEKRHEGHEKSHEGHEKSHEGYEKRHEGSCERHKASDTMYKLHINATTPNGHSNNSHIYRAIVHDKPSKKIRSLTFFKGVGKTN